MCPHATESKMNVDIFSVTHCAEPIVFSSLSAVRHVISLLLYIKRYKHVHAYTCIHGITCNCIAIFTLPLPSKKRRRRKRRENKTTKKLLHPAACSLQPNARTGVGLKERGGGGGGGSVATVRNSVRQSDPNLRINAEHNELQCKLVQ